MKITSDKTLTVRGPSDLRQKHWFTITPEMGEVSHFPREVCKALIEKGATEVVKESSQEVEAQAEQLGE